MNLQSLFLLLGLSISVAASGAPKVQYDHVLKTNGAFSLTLENGETKLDHALLLEEALLKNFSPSGVKILKKVVNGREFELLIEKSIFGFVKRFTILGNIQVERKASGCGVGESAYEVFFDFSQSGSDVTEAVAAFGLDICSKVKGVNNLSISTKNGLYYRGKKYGMITEPIAKSVLNDQVVAFFNSVKTTASQIHLKD